MRFQRQIIFYFTVAIAVTAAAEMGIVETHGGVHNEIPKTNNFLFYRCHRSMNKPLLTPMFLNSKEIKKSFFSLHLQI